MVCPESLVNLAKCQNETNGKTNVYVPSRPCAPTPVAAPPTCECDKPLFLPGPCTLTLSFIAPVDRYDPSPPPSSGRQLDTGFSSGWDLIWPRIRYEHIRLGF